MHISLIANYDYYFFLPPKRHTTVIWKYVKVFPVEMLKCQDRDKSRVIRQKKAKNLWWKFYLKWYHRIVDIINRKDSRVDSFWRVWVILPNFWPNFEELECYSRTKWFQGLSQQTEDIRERPPAFWLAGARLLEASDIYQQHTSLTPFSFSTDLYTHAESSNLCSTTYN